MNIFEPRTYSTDWEIMVVDRLDRWIDNFEILLGFAGELKAELDLPVQVDWNTLEFAMGINSSFDQFWNRIKLVTDRAVQMLHEYDLDLFPAGAHPIAPMFNSSHIHVGTIHDESAGIRMESQLMRYSPAFAALAANSPVAEGRRGEFKSYRVRHIAHGCTRPGTLRDPQFAQPEWGTDAAPKVYGVPTLEVRITDCASSRRLLAEFATFIAAYVHYQGTKIDNGCKMTAEDYRECLTNRWAAAKYGLQATFSWHGKPITAVDLINEMLDECKAELAALGAKRLDLNIINAMLEKRFCQADFVLGMMDRYKDPYLLSSAYAKLVRHWEIFEEYLESAPTLEPALMVDEKTVIAEHLSFVGEGTHFYRLREAMFYPAPATDEIIEAMIEQELIKREITPSCGTLLHRIG
ncbi:hypothetical protein LLG46_09900 [bacterium]|nr:hypothetical protein [bacterium]